jgi:glycosyltransferase involved in cell wall biosynthesis
VSTEQPKVSIGLPVYNGENFLTEALDSILAQTFTDFEVIISDNASADRTQDICREYVARDKRIRYFRNAENLGACWNQNQVIKLSNGQYYKMWAHDDLCAPEYLERCVDVLDRDPSVVLCHSKVALIDANGDLIEYFDGYNRLSKQLRRPMLDLDSLKTVARFRELTVPHMCYQIFGLMRSRALKMTPLFGAYSAADNVLLTRLGLMGRFYEVPEYLFFARSHAQQSMQVCDNHDKYAEWWDPKNKGQLNLPRLKIFLEYWDAVNRASISWREKLPCYIHLLSVLKRTRLPIYQELVLAGRYLLRRRKPMYLPEQKVLKA